MSENTNNKQRLTIRIGRNTLAFATLEGEGQGIAYEPFVVKSGISMAANLREAFKTADLLLQAPPRVRVAIDSNTLIVPVEQFEEGDIETLHRHAFPGHEQETVFYNVLPDLNSVAVFSMNKDLKLVIDDHFQDVRLVTAISPVWRHLHQRSFTGTREKLYGYFHEKRLEVFCFQQNRFRFCNSYDAGRTKDAQYFLLYIWNQLSMNSESDELHLVGEIPDEDTLLPALREFIQNVYVINPVADFNNHEATEIKGMPYDLVTLFVKGR